MIQKEQKTQLRSRHWSGTLFLKNDELRETFGQKLPPAAIAELFRLQKIKYFIIGFEKTQEDLEHYQLYLYTKNKISREALKKLTYNFIHIDPSYGSTKQNIQYCRKTGDYLQMGVPPDKPGRRSDLRSIGEQIIKHPNKLYKLTKKYPSQFIQYAKGIKTLAQTVSAKKIENKWRPKCWMLISYDTFVRSKSAIMEHRIYFMAHKFAGYANQKVIAVLDKTSDCFPCFFQEQFTYPGYRTFDSKYGYVSNHWSVVIFLTHNRLAILHCQSDNKDCCPNACKSIYEEICKNYDEVCTTNDTTEDVQLCDQTQGTGDRASPISI